MSYLTTIVAVSIIGDDLENTRIIGRLGGQGEWIDVAQCARVIVVTPISCVSVRNSLSPMTAKCGRVGGDIHERCAALPLVLLGRW